jgi:uncharacterized protein YjbJ (UPF0337 family)
MQLKLESPWEEVKEKMKENNIHLTDDDLLYEPGQEDALLERLAKKMGRSKDEVRVLIESISFNTGLAG